MQRSARSLAYHAIAHVMDWRDRQNLWAAARLELSEVSGVCAFEPRSPAQTQA
jgi:hypothetical protein